jgi:hypothetical protein
MTDGQAGVEVADAGALPATVRVIEVPAVSEARDALLQAIGREAEHVADKSAGQAAAALEQLARAYALVISGATPGSSVPGTSVGLVPVQTRAEFPISLIMGSEG